MYEHCFELLLATLISCALATTVAGDQTATQPAHDDSHLTTIKASSTTLAGTTTELSLYRQQIGPFDTQQLMKALPASLARSRQKNKSLKGQGVCFLMINGKGKDGRPNVVACCYINFFWGAVPHPICGADFIMDPQDEKKVIIVTARSVGVAVETSVYFADTDRPIAEFPVSFALSDYEKWPAGSAPVSVHKETLRKGGCGVGALRIAIDGNLLLIYEAREQKDCPAVYMGFDLKSNKWKDTLSEAEAEILRATTRPASTAPTTQPGRAK